MLKSSIKKLKQIIGQNTTVSNIVKNHPTSDYNDKNLHHFHKLAEILQTVTVLSDFCSCQMKAIRQTRQTTGESTPGRPTTTHKTEKKKQEKKLSAGLQNFPTFSQGTNQPITFQTFQLHHLQHIQSRRKRRRGTHLLDRWTNGRMDGWRASAAVRRCVQISHIYSGVAMQPHLLFMEKTTSSDQSDGWTPPEISRPAARRGRGLIRPGPEPLRYKRQELYRRTDRRRRQGSITGIQLHRSWKEKKSAAFCKRLPQI